MDSSYVQITNLLATYSDVIDTADYPALQALFADATLHMTVSGRTIRGGEQIAAHYRSVMRLVDGRPRTRHLSTNHHMTIDEAADRAECRSGYLVVQQVGEAQIVVISGGDYRDRFVRREGVWCFEHRTIDRWLQGDQSSHLNVEAIAAETSDRD